MDADSFAVIAGLFVLFWGALAAIVALVRSLDLPADQRMGAVLGVIFLMVALVVFWGVRKCRRDRSSVPPPAGRDAERMVRCEICALNVPQSESVCVQGRFFCSLAHAEAATKGNARR